MIIQASKRILAVLLPLMLIAGCGNGNEEQSFSGQTDSDTIVLSSQSAGIITSVLVDEGTSVEKGDLLAEIDTERLELQRQQQAAQLDGIEARIQAALSQIDQAKKELSLSEETLAKTEKLLPQGGATQQRRDELATQVGVGRSKIRGLEANYDLLQAQKKELLAGMKLTDIAIRDSSISAPIDGVVLNRFHEAGELAATGTPLFELADLSSLTVKIYVPLAQLPALRIGSEVSIMVTGSEERLTGKVEQIADESEFTPKTILTKETRETLVYEVKISVPNPGGLLKIGMPVDVYL
ncbi:HlyD family secretion protein [Sediminispirochaeta bajacaliforniensis]|uniref:HlyD family secretion protein n=1 Tax=Sediminispirochaeta bajacaliforniensis TaxID=148 RepID=UPI0003701529|nr:HlyD family efflux transporter periplasmic adaptor subunit [Sediminispirochaeta bajacaliforniensis]